MISYDDDPQKKRTNRDEGGRGGGAAENEEEEACGRVRGGGGGRPSEQDDGGRKSAERSDAEVGDDIVDIAKRLDEEEHGGAKQAKAEAEVGAVGTPTGAEQAKAEAEVGARGAPRPSESESSPSDGSRPNPNRRTERDGGGAARTDPSSTNDLGDVDGAPPPPEGASSTAIAAPAPSPAPAPATATAPAPAPAPSPPSSPTESRTPGAVSVPGPWSFPQPLAGGLRRQEEDASVLPLPPNVTAAGGSGGGTSQLGLSPPLLSPLETHVTATLVEDFDDEADGRDRGAAEANNSRNGNGSGAALSSPASPVDPLDYAHTVAVPADSVVPLGGPSSRSTLWSFRKNRKTLCIAVSACLLFAAVVAAAVGAAVGLTVGRTDSGSGSGVNDSAEQEGNVTGSTIIQGEEQEEEEEENMIVSEGKVQKDTQGVPATAEERFKQMRSFLLPFYDDVPGSAFSLYRDELDLTWTYRYAALKWLAEGDASRLVPYHEPHQKRLLNRYVAALLFFSTGGRLPRDDPGRAAQEGLLQQLLQMPVGSRYGTWVERANFLTSRPTDHECEWWTNLGEGATPRGITCDEDGEITGISLVANGLTNTVPPELTLLPRLVNLDLSENFLSGSVNILCGGETAAAVAVGEDNGENTVAVAQHSLPPPRDWTELRVDCLEDVECDCCTDCTDNGF